MNEEKIKDHELIYALDEAKGVMVYIEDIPLEKRGLACSCICPKCSRPLIAKLGHDVPHGKKPHFAHQKGCDCHGAQMTAIHRLSEEILKEEKTVTVPEYKRIPHCKIIFEEIELEQRGDRADLQPDLVGIMFDGTRWHIEICNTSEVKEEKRIKIRTSGITCLEIDVRGHEEDTKEELKNFLVNSIDSRKWINNANYEKKLRGIRERIKRGKILALSNYKSTESYEVKFAYECYDECIFHGRCIYLREKEIVEGIEVVICDNGRKIKDSESSSRFDENIKERQETSQSFSYSQTEERDYRFSVLEDIMKGSNQIFNYNVDGQTLDEVLCDLKNKGFVDYGSIGMGEIFMCDKIAGLNGIVLLVRCAEYDRSYSLQLLVAGIDVDTLRYILITKTSNIETAKEKYRRLRDSFNDFYDEIFKDNNSHFLTPTNDLPF